MTATKGKPFLKWAGGKTQLLPTIDSFLPESFRKEREITYIEPFVGGGAMLFFILQKYPNVKRAIINDINSHLITTYRAIRNEPTLLIDCLSDIQERFRQCVSHDRQKEFYLEIRHKFNTVELSDVEEASFMIFLNRTCFNGLYRENSKGSFNVPFGRYMNPTICDKQLLLTDSQLLKRVEILNGDFSRTADYIGKYTFFYFDPPYRPLNTTSKFTSYVRYPFNDDDQRRLRDCFAELSERGCFMLLSNSDGRLANGNDTFIDDLYQDYIIERVHARRNINSKPSKRGSITEVLIRNYRDYQGPSHQ